MNALQLAEALNDGDMSSSVQDGAAAELRRLHEVNQGLIKDRKSVV